MWKLTNDVLLLVGPTFLQKIIAFLQDSDKPLYVGALYAFGLLSTSLVQTLAIHVVRPRKLPFLLAHLIFFCLSVLVYGFPCRYAHARGSRHGHLS